MNDALHLYNTRSRTLEPFTSRTPHQVGLYVCGPTVYGPPHLGHARSAVTFDLLVRYLRHLGYQVAYVRNITDVGHMTHEDVGEGEDKMLRQAEKEGRTPMEVAHYYTLRYREAMNLLNVLPPSIEPCATGHITEQIALIEKLLEKGYAYLINGSVYFDVPRYDAEQPYGVLSGQKLEDVRTGMRSLVAGGEKRHPADFALWKSAPKSHIMGWPSPWGRGYPGWHSECAAMSVQYLGTHFDIHGGGLDLALHHDCEAAQVKASSGKELARFWMHHNLVTLQDQKMSKSAGNFISLEECFSGDHPLLSRPYPPMSVRFFLLHAHYRSPLHCSEESLLQAAKSYEKLINGYKMATESIKSKEHAQAFDAPYSDEVVAACRACHAAMNHDLNTTQLIPRLFTLLRYITERDSSSKKLSQAAWETLHKTYILFVRDILGLQPPASSDVLIEALMEQYKSAKAAKEYDHVDAIRQALQKEGITIQDGVKEIQWSYKII